MAATTAQLSQALSLFDVDVDIVTLCLSLIGSGDSLGRSRDVKVESGSLVSILVELELPRGNDELGTCRVRRPDPTSPPRSMTLDMINYKSYRYAGWSIRIEPQLLEYAVEATHGQHLGESLTFKLLIAKGRGAVALPHKFDRW